MPGGKLASAAAIIISCKSSAVGSDGVSGGLSSESCSESSSDSGGGLLASLLGSGGCSVFSSEVSSAADSS